ncbi:hypothetical protein AMB3_3154 [plant metagenome]
MRPQARQQAGGARRARAAVLAGRQGRHQVQALAGPRGCHVQQAVCLVFGAAALAARQEQRDRIMFLFRARLHRPQQHPALALLETHQRRLVAARGAFQAVQDDRVELQALGFVHGHDFDRGPVGIRGREQARHRGIQGVGVQAAIGRQALDQPQQALRIAHVARAGVQAGAAEQAPDALDPGREGHAARRIALIQQDRGRAGQARMLSSSQHGARRLRAVLALRQRTRHQHGHRQAMIGAEERVQAVQRQAAQGRAQHGEPGQPVTRMRQGAHQLDQVGHALTARQRHQFDRAAGDAVAGQAAREAPQVAARAHQHRHRMRAVRVRGQGLARQSRDAVGAGIGILLVRPDRMELQRGAVHGGMERRRWRVADRARHGVICRRQHLREDVVDPSHHARLRTEVVGQGQEGGTQGAQALVAHMQEQAHFRLAEAVDRLHGVAHQEERAAIAVLPAGRERADQVDLRLAGVLELVDEQMTDGGVETQQQLAWVVGPAQRSLHALRDLDEVDFSGLGELQLQLCGSQAQGHQLRAQHVPLRIAETGLGQAAHAIQAGDPRRCAHVAMVFEPRGEGRLVRALGREAQVLVDATRTAQPALLGQQQVRQRAPARQGVRVG